MNLLAITRYQQVSIVQYYTYWDHISHTLLLCTCVECAGIGNLALYVSVLSVFLVACQSHKYCRTIVAKHDVENIFLPLWNKYEYIITSLQNILTVNCFVMYLLWYASMFIGLSHFCVTLSYMWIVISNIIDVIIDDICAK